MIQITPQMRILLAVEPVDFRKGIDGLVGLCRQKLEADPFSGALFVFSSRSRKSIKIQTLQSWRQTAGLNASRLFNSLTRST